MIRVKRVQIEKEILQYDPNYVSLQDIEVQQQDDTNEEEADIGILQSFLFSLLLFLTSGLGDADTQRLV